MKTPGWVHQQSQWAADGLLFSQVRGGGGNGVQVRSGYARGCQTNLPGIVAGQNGGLVLKMVHRSTVKAEAFCHPFIMAVLVLRFFGSGKVHWGGAIITIVSASGVTHGVGSGRGCLSGGRVGINRAARVGGVGSDSVIEFHAQFDKFVKILRLIGLVNETGLEFLGEPPFESGLLCLAVVIQNRH
jgi:hypothetical protein